MIMMFLSRIGSHTLRFEEAHVLADGDDSLPVGSERMAYHAVQGSL
jgi:hypothetical protein